MTSKYLDRPLRTLAEAQEEGVRTARQREASRIDADLYDLITRVDEHLEHHEQIRVHLLTARHAIRNQMHQEDRDAAP